MGRRSGDQQHFQDQAPANRNNPVSKHTKAIGLSARYRDGQTSPRARGPSKQQRRIEQQHSRYPFSQTTLWLSVLVFLSFTLAALYWVVMLSSTQP